jgi:hypothetical protein
MAARDIFHAAVRQALITDGWTITHDPFFVGFGGVDLYIDLGAEKLIAAERDNQQIAVEVKSFLGPSLVSDFHAALGQFLNYQLAMEAYAPTRTCIWRCRSMPTRPSLSCPLPRRSLPATSSA